MDSSTNLQYTTINKPGRNEMGGTMDLEIILNILIYSVLALNLCLGSILSKKQNGWPATPKDKSMPKLETNVKRIQKVTMLDVGVTPNRVRQGA